MTQGNPVQSARDIEVHLAGAGDLPRILALADVLRKPEAAEEFPRHFEYQAKGEREILIAVLNGQDAGYCIFNRQPLYGLFRKLGIPEIQDLNVIPAFRRLGVAKALIARCESLARREGYGDMGIGVGLHAGYGAAQRLYVSLGYIPDGMGVTYDRMQVAGGEFRPVDDSLSLMMVKVL